MFFRLNLPLNKFRRQCYKFRRQCYDGVGNMSGQRTCVAKRIQELEPGQSNHILKAKRWMWQRAACWSKAPCWCEVDITRRHQTYKVFAPKRRYVPSNQGEYRPTRRQWQNQCSNHVPYQMDDKGSITSNCPVLRSTPDDANDVDRARYGDEGKNSRHFVSNEQILLPVRDHIGRTTAETRP